MNFFNKSQLNPDEIQEIKRKELSLENLINKYRFFVITFLIVTDYFLMFLLDRMDQFVWIEEILGLISVYGLLYLLHRITLIEKPRPRLKYITIFIDYIIVLGCFHEGRDVIMETTGIAIDQYILLIFALILMTNILSVFRLKVGTIMYSTIIALIFNLFLMDEYRMLPIEIFYTSLVILLSGFFSQYVSKYICNFFIINYQLSSTINALELAHEEIKEQNHELEIQNVNLAEQRDQISKQKTQITNSITYASRIQSAVLDSRKEIDEVTPDNFILFRPKDIVSGDFYWFRNVDVFTKRYNVFTAVDCTGHGVPGAFMSMLGTSFLNEIITEFYDELNAAQILNRLREEVKGHLRQNSGKEIVKDGMDMALCAIDYQEMVVQFAGAHNPLYIIRNEKGKPSSEIEEIKPDRMPIGVFIKEKESFTNHLIPINKGDKIYLFSDGYIDQFGGNRGEKFKKSRFKQILLDTAHLKMKDQKVILEQTLDNWQGGVHKQIDDITVIGVQV